MTRHPAAYIRKSYVDHEAPGDISEAAQLAEVRRLAALDGHNGDLETFSDWNLSADAAKSAARTEYTRLLADMENGQISAVYAFDTDRIYRDVRDLIRLQDAARRHAVTITTKAGRLPIGDADDPAGEGFAFITAVFGRMELQKAKKRNAAALEARRVRGDVIGQAGFGHVLARDEAGRIIEIPGPDHDRAMAVVEAYRLTGSIMRTSKYLQNHGIPAPRGGKKWGTHTVSNILSREASELFPRRGKPSKGSPAGRRTPTTVWYAQLAACHCGATMSPNGARHQLQCPWGHRLGGAAHGRMTISANALQSYVMAELDHFALPSDTYELAKDDAARRTAVAARLERYRELYLEGGEHGIDKRRWDAEKARYDADLAALDDRQTVVKLPPRDELWSYADRDISKILRSIFVRVDLDTDMEPTAVWRNPALRQPCDDSACTHCQQYARQHPVLTAHGYKA
ncbi:MAG TPA: recombinase family protein [Candidatus Limnocylindrales bacterium]